ncbi:oxidoreductase [Mycolicibacterium canariasense]|uniref:Oxidoreductase n=1 Tax=Mycolicibacterium canariasense TaxID=228230 RepID=A0A124E1G3_MYCCR|nr:SDR family NAD(P)-dependent oxidoreductase [Mycolicibacterium canariasense]ORV10636.1 hypothetical protein AWB94_06995 [Mycolicibacterium canariasense]GAS93555.1 oxidoreductase [Mycolicibacterium canariasense]
MDRRHVVDPTMEQPGGPPSRALADQTVVVLGGSAGVGLETAPAAHVAGARVILTGRDPQRLARAATEVSVAHTASFDVTDEAALGAFFGGLSAIDHVLLTAGAPRYGPLLEMDADAVRHARVITRRSR